VAAGRVHRLPTFYVPAPHLGLGKRFGPVALACGADTDAFGPEYLERYASRLTTCSGSVLPGLGHFGPLEDPDAVAAWVVAGFLPPGNVASR